MSRSQKVGHVLLLWLPDSPRDCWVFSPFPLLFLLSGVTTFTLLGLCIRWLQLSLPLLRQQSFSSWRSPLLKCQSLKLCCSWVTHAEPAYGGHTHPGFFSGIKKQTAIFGWPQYPRRASRLLAHRAPREAVISKASYSIPVSLFPRPRERHLTSLWVSAPSGKED